MERLVERGSKDIAKQRGSDPSERETKFQM